MPGLIAALLWTLTHVSQGADAMAPAALHAEVQALLAGLEAPGCRFQRNGHWYTGAEARAHLARKWQEMDRRRMANSTEQFIEQGASRSMVSGEPYWVQCGTAPPVSSLIWLTARLRALRAGASAK